MKAEAMKMAKMTLIQYHHMGTSTARTLARGVAVWWGRSRGITEFQYALNRA
jgi:hypothetical protein